MSTAVSTASGPPPPAADVFFPASTWRLITRRVRSNRVGLFAMLFLILVVAAAVAAPLIAPRDPNAQNLLRSYEGLSWEHLLGTDRFGRDTFSRLLVGTRTTLLAATVAVVVATVLGVPLGLIAGYRGGWFDAVVGRFSDGLMGMPSLIAALTIVAILGNGLTKAMLAVGIVVAPRFFRLARASALDVRGEYFIEAARSIGASTTRIITKHVLPNVISPIIVQISLMFGFAIIAEASLAYIGIGVQLPRPSWGSMILAASQDLSSRPWDILPPGIAVVLCVLAFASFGDAISDASTGPTPEESLA